MEDLLLTSAEHKIVWKYKRFLETQYGINLNMPKFEGDSQDIICASVVGQEQKNAVVNFLKERMATQTQPRSTAGSVPPLITLSDSEGEDLDGSVIPIESADSSLVANGEQNANESVVLIDMQNKSSGKKKKKKKQKCQNPQGSLRIAAVIDITSPVAPNTENRVSPDAQNGQRFEINRGFSVSQNPGEIVLLNRKGSKNKKRKGTNSINSQPAKRRHVEPASVPVQPDFISLRPSWNRNRQKPNPVQLTVEVAQQGGKEKRKVTRQWMEPNPVCPFSAPVHPSAVCLSPVVDDVVVLDNSLPTKEVVAEEVPRPVVEKRLRPVVIDGSNVAREHGKVGNTYSCQGIRLSVEFFLRRGHPQVTAFVPQFRRHCRFGPVKTTDQDILEDLAKTQNVVFTPSRKINGKTVASYDDRFIVELACSNGGVILSNDNYKDLIDVSDAFKETIEKRLLMFCFVGNLLMIPDDPLGRHGPTLAQFLCFPET